MNVNLVGKYISLPNLIKWDIMDLEISNIYSVIKDFKLKLRERDNLTSVDEVGNFVYIEKLSSNYVGLYKIVTFVNQMDESVGNTYNISIYNSIDGITDDEERTNFTLENGRSIQLILNTSNHPYIRYHLDVSGSSPSVDFEMFLSDII